MDSSPAKPDGTCQNMSEHVNTCWVSALVFHPSWSASKITFDLSYISYWLSTTTVWLNSSKNWLPFLNFEHCTIHDQWSQVTMLYPSAPWFKGGWGEGRGLGLPQVLMFWRRTIIDFWKSNYISKYTIFQVWPLQFQNQIHTYLSSLWHLKTNP